MSLEDADKLKPGDVVVWQSPGSSMSLRLRIRTIQWLTSRPGWVCICTPNVESLYYHGALVPVSEIELA